MSQPFDFEEIYTAYGDGIFRFCLHLTGDYSDAEDLTQDTFLAAIQASEKFRGEASVTTWLYRIAHHKARKFLRRRSLSRLVVPHIIQAPDPTGRVVMETGVSRLPTAIREAFLLVKVEGLSCEEASLVLGCPVGTVKYRVHHAVMRLRNLLSEAGESTKNEAPHAL